MLRDSRRRARRLRRWGALVSVLLFAASCGRRDAAPPAARGRVHVLAEARTSPHAYGRAGDVVLVGDGASLTFAKTPHRPGHRPLEGSLVDIATDAGDHADPLLWYRPGWMGADGKVHVLVAETVEPRPCDGPAVGVRVAGVVDDVRIESDVCAEPRGRFLVRSRALGLPAGAELVDELHPGTAATLLESQGQEWEGEHSSSLVAFGEGGLAMVLEAERPFVARRNLVHIATETFPAPVLLRYGASEVVRALRVLAGDGFAALATARASTRDVGLALEPGASGTFVVRSAEGRELGRGVVPKDGRTLRLPPSFGAQVELFDADGVRLPSPVRLEGAPTPSRRERAPRGRLRLRLVGSDGAPLAAHVLFRGRDGTADPTPPSSAGSGARAFAAGPSLYAVDGAVDVALPVGSYEVLATHGPAFGLARFVVAIADGGVVERTETLRRLVDTTGWTAADFHLHAAPSPDAPVSLEQRVASLACEGVELAVATDHNHVTDYAPAVQNLGRAARDLVTLRGNEITSSGVTLWGHFNAYPLPPPEGGAGYEAASSYFDVLPKDMFEDARRRGARVVQVNHPRMPPRIGYFDLAGLDPRTGDAGVAFADGFDAVEAHNGIWLEAPERVREGVRDLVALARRGRRPTATGNSDSHRLLFEEAGWPRTYVHAAGQPEASRGDRVIDALLRGDTTVSAGPFVESWVEGQGIGATVRPRAGKVSVRMRVSAPAWVPVERVEIWRDDKVVFQAAVEGPDRDGVRFERTVDIAVPHDAVLVAWAEAQKPLPPVLPYAGARAIGFTGLTYVDADGDGKVVPPPGEP